MHPCVAVMLIYEQRTGSQPRRAFQCEAKWSFYWQFRSQLGMIISPVLKTCRILNEFPSIFQQAPAAFVQQAIASAGQ
jgi:hypothetical protein